MKLLFVHGTGVRKESFTETFRIVGTRAKCFLPNLSIHPCYWGDACGSRLAAGGASIPEYDKTRALSAAPSEEDTTITLWELLYQDPLFECRLLLSDSAKPPLFGGISPEKEAITKKLEKPLTDSAEAEPLRAKLSDAEQAELSAAAKWIEGQGEFKDFLLRTPDIAQIGDAIGRAVVARIIASALEREQTSRFELDAGARDDLVNAVKQAVVGAQRGLVGKILLKVTKPLIGLGTRMAARHRGGLMDGASSAVGDVLVYQARGAQFRDFVRNEIRQLQDSIVLVAHSLGGIVCVDMLIEKAIPEVKLFVTAGSQSSYFYEIGALQSLAFDANPVQRLPAHFPKWLNFYDRRDFLGFAANKIFDARVTDVEVNNRQPFPQSHSAYWGNDTVWDIIAQNVAAL
jgi:hypothetical protein